MRALEIAASGMTAQQTRVEVISNNLANMSTTGYSPRRAEFADLHYQQMVRPGTISAADGTVLPVGVQLGLGVRPTAVSVMIAQGPVAATGNDLDTDASWGVDLVPVFCGPRRPTGAVARAVDELRALAESCEYDPHEE